MTILESLIDNLPTKYVNAIINNIKDKEIVNEKSLDFAHDLMVIFDWEDSRQGYEFWENVLEAVLNNTNLPLLPAYVTLFPGTILAVNNVLLLMNIADTGLNIELGVDMSLIMKTAGSMSSQKKKEQIYLLLN